MIPSTNGVMTAQGRAWNYVSADDMQPVTAVMYKRRLSARVQVVNYPNGVHLRSDGHTLTIKGFDSKDTVTIDYRNGGGILGVFVGGKLLDITLSNFGSFAPVGIQNLHICAINNS